MYLAVSTLVVALLSIQLYSCRVAYFNPYMCNINSALSPPVTLTDPQEFKNKWYHS